MKGKAISLIAVSILFVQSIFNGCSDTNQIISPAPVTVSGKILNLFNQGTPDIKVMILNQSAITSANGNFSFPGIYPPYTLKVIDAARNKTQNFYGLSSANISIPGIEYYTDSLNCRISVSYPPEILLPGVGGKIMFTDGNYVNSYDIFPSGNLNVVLKDYSQITGKLILLTYKKDAAGKIISYENFGVSSPIQVNAGGNYSYDFSLQEVSLNPGEKNVTGTINIQPGYSFEYKFFYLTFSTKKTPNYSILLLFELITGNNFNIIIPDNIPLDYSTIIYCTQYEGQVYNAEFFKLPQGTGITLETKSPPELLTPPDNATNVDVTTVFSFTSGTGDGIYLVNFFDETTSKIYSAYTTSNSFRLGEFIDLFENGIPGSNFRWSVEKIGFNNSVNDYATTYIDRPEGFKTQTADRSFSTTP